ncbi:MAG: tRNA 2-thiocytidine(32) synthetase TtcA [Clostridia bacterium]|nr:tRNA 2-thiocytidine(32) synthetase TtcA [Clostridia bacterium]
MQRILSYMRRAVDDYGMIEDGEKIAVGVSGGKDSVTMLMALAALRRFYPKKFELEAITLDMGFDGADFSPIAHLCAELGVNYTLVKTDIKAVVFDIRKETNPCALCAKMRKGALNEKALELGCKKVALGHHNEDVIETFFLSLFYEGRLNCFSPVTYLDRKGVTLIRPLVYAPEKLVKSFANANNIPIVKNPCPADGNTKREKMKEFVLQQHTEDKGFKERVFGAVVRGLDGWKLNGE